MKLRERLAQLRQSNNYKYRELRERIHEATGDLMAMSYLSTLEKEDRTPSIDTLTKIAAGYGMTLQELLAPVVLDGEPVPTFDEVFEEFAAEKHMTDVEKEEMWRFEYRGKRPKSKADWELLYFVLDSMDKRQP